MLVLLTALFGTLALDKTYKAVTGIRVEKPEGDALFRNQVTGNYDPFFIKEQFLIIQSKKILHKVIDDLDLQKILSKKLKYPFTREETYQYMIRKMLEVEGEPGTSIINIAVYVKEDPDLASLIANTIAHVYAEDPPFIRFYPLGNRALGLYVKNG